MSNASIGRAKRILGTDDGDSKRGLGVTKFRLTAATK
jgi:hypothetical protein